MLDYYKEQFDKLGKSEIFELNKHFIEEICAIKERILKVRKLVGDNYIIVHPTNPEKTRVPESELWLLKLEDQFRNMIIALNRIVGSVGAGEVDPMEEWMNAHRG